MNAATALPLSPISQSEIDLTRESEEADAYVIEQAAIQFHLEPDEVDVWVEDTWYHARFWDSDLTCERIFRAMQMPGRRDPEIWFLEV